MLSVIGLLSIWKINSVYFRIFDYRIEADGGQLMLQQDL